MRTNKANSNKKYLSRCFYYGKLLDWEFVESAMILKFTVYTATEYYGKDTIIRIYVPTELEQHLMHTLTIGDKYMIVSAPYRVKFKQRYNHRVDLLLQIFKEVI